MDPSPERQAASTGNSPKGGARAPTQRRSTIEGDSQLLMVPLIEAGRGGNNNNNNNSSMPTMPDSPTTPLSLVDFIRRGFRSFGSRSLIRGDDEGKRPSGSPMMMTSPKKRREEKLKENKRKKKKKEEQG